MSIVIIDYGLGNINSIVGALKKLKVKYLFSRDPKDIEKSSKIILPGVGSFENGMKNLEKFKLNDKLNN